jgi:glycosyltransferase involved in cell wall biosynthesis
MRVGVIASSRFPIREPFAGGLEAHTHGLVRALRARGHDVTLFATAGSDPQLRAELLDVPPLEPRDGSRRDLARPAGWMAAEARAYYELMVGLAHRDLDVIHNNSLHQLPIEMAPTLVAPMVTTLHTPPLRWLEAAAARVPSTSHFVAVSESTRRSWSTVQADVIHNGVDPATWRRGDGGSRAVWTGRMVPEKAPHEAIRAARLAGLSIDLVGPIGDEVYFERHVRPLLGLRTRYLGHLSQASVRRVVARARVAVVSPAWPEPFGLVAVEALMTGTPVAAYACGALPEIISPETGRLAVPGDVADLARAIRAAAVLDRRTVRRHATARFGLDTMIDSYEAVYSDLVGVRAA